jgi:hypothetical protein
VLPRVFSTMSTAHPIIAKPHNQEVFAWVDSFQA